LPAVDDVPPHVQHLDRAFLAAKIHFVPSFGAEQRAELSRLTDIYGGRIADVTDSSYIIELTGDGAKLGLWGLVAW
jgi:acetolactate synthase-1/3 small subunit